MVGKYIILGTDIHRINEHSNWPVPGVVGVIMKGYALTPVSASVKPAHILQSTIEDEGLALYDSEEDARIAFSKMVLTGKTIQTGRMEEPFNGLRF